MEPMEETNISAPETAAQRIATLLLTAMLAGVVRLVILVYNGSL